MNKKITFIDLFAGCGGLSLGLELASFKSLLFSEINTSAAETYFNNSAPSNHPPTFVKDATSLNRNYIKILKSQWSINGIKDVDLIVGGPPCWGYSNIGLRRTFDSDKVNVPTNHLYKDMARIIDDFKPRMFMFENVKGLLSARWTKNGQKGQIWKDVLSTFEGIDGYDVESETVKSYHYGVPQKRPRVIIVGIRQDLSWKNDSLLPCNGLLPKPHLDGIPTIEEFLSDLIDPDYKSKTITEKYPSKPQSEIQRQLRTKLDGKVARKGSALHNHKYSNHSERIVKKFDYMINNGGKVLKHMKTKKFNQRVLPRKWLNGTPNITVTSLPDDYVHYEQPRSITVREWARLQTFPDYFEFCGPRTTGGRRRAGTPYNNFEIRDIPQYTQIGNAVPVVMAREFGKHFLKILKSNW